jgi:hypothetical protein
MNKPKTDGRDLVPLDPQKRLQEAIDLMARAALDMVRDKLIAQTREDDGRPDDLDEEEPDEAGQ